MYPECEYRHFLVHMGAIGGGHRVDKILDLAVAEFGCSSLGHQLGGGIGKTFLALGIADGSVIKHQLNDHLVGTGQG